MKAHLNPFAPDRMQRLLPFDPTLVGTTWEQIESDWDSLGRRAAIIGHKGSGKSTFLKTFAKRLRTDYQVISLFFREKDRSLSLKEHQLLENLCENSILLVDGEGHLGLRERQQLRSISKQARGYLAVRHHRCTLPTLRRLKSETLLAENLLERMNLDNPAEIQKRLPSLLRAKRGNLREVWLSLYDEFATLR